MTDRSRPDPSTDPDAAEEQLDELGEEIEETREETRDSRAPEDREDPTTGFTPRTAENPADPDARAGGTLPDE